MKPLPCQLLLAAAAFALAGCVAQNKAETAAGTAKPKAEAVRIAKASDGKTPIMMRIFKEEGVLEVWRKGSGSRYALAASYPICKWSGKLGPKFAEGDRQAPEGFYTVHRSQMNPNSDYHLSFDIGYPNAFDRSNGRYGNYLMVHGACSSAGCYSMTDSQIEEIYAFAETAFKGGQSAFQVEAFPFRMTEANMARYKGDPNLPFWTMLKEGYDSFEATGTPPKVDVCGRRYVFNRNPKNGAEFDASKACPPSEPSLDMKTAFADDAAQPKGFASLLSPGKPPAPSISGIEEAALAADWSARRLKGERVSRTPPTPSEVSQAVLDSALRPVLQKSARAMLAAAAARRRMPVATASAAPAAIHPKRF